MDLVYIHAGGVRTGLHLFFFGKSVFLKHPNVHAPPRLGRDWKIHPLRPRDFPWPLVLHPSTLGISLGLRHREIPRVSGCKTHGRGKSLKISLDPRDFPRASPSGNLLGLGKSWASGMDFPIPPSSWWSTDTIHQCIFEHGKMKRVHCRDGNLLKNRPRASTISPR